MWVACLDMEGVLVPEIWVNVAESTGIAELRFTTREICDYDELMTHRMRVLYEHGLKLSDIQRVIAKMQPYDGAVEFLAWLQERGEVLILSDTFIQFARPLITQLGNPTILCHSLVVKDDRIVDYQVRLSDQKRAAVRAFQGLNYQTVAVGDSYNDLTMLRAADIGVLFRPPSQVAAEHPQLPVRYDYESLRELIQCRMNELQDPTAVVRSS
ncbi:MAG: bifunctional phosphoserine phosphatase/homoserine phosphotransferase ThrH [Propionibacteriaceae bacterium]|jgi:phosphoserine/homoserine phosphotransferase|nr:bifunctional phosphoserine phosphatase/homoserine phosphotransferase ThrH [Propionibacteriaceae bacterium]